MFNKQASAFGRPSGVLGVLTCSVERWEFGVVEGRGGFVAAVVLLQRAPVNDLDAKACRLAKESH